MKRSAPISKSWSNYRIGLTGAKGSLGNALSQKLRDKGAFVIGLTHSSLEQKQLTDRGPHEFHQWSCGNEESLKQIFSNLDILIINHGINPLRKQSTKDINSALEINAFSAWRLIEIFEEVSLKKTTPPYPKEIWINTSEAEIQPAFSPIYEISKRLIGQLVSIKSSNYNSIEKEKLKIRKLVLGPFKSSLNPFGIMSANFVADAIIKQIELNISLIIISPNPITYILMPITEIVRSIYYNILKE